MKTVLRERQGTAEVTGLDGVPRSTASRRWAETPTAASSSARAAPRRASSRTRTTTCAATCCSRGSASWRRLPSATSCERAARALELHGRGVGTALRRRRPHRPRPRSEGARRADRRGQRPERRRPGHRAAPGRADAPARELVAAEEETRRRIAADIHDDTAQAVAAAGLRMDALASELNDPAEREAVLKARTALIEANRRLRRLLFELRPPALDEAGLGAALELFLTDSFAHDGFDWRVENRLEDEPGPEAARDPLPGGARGPHQRSKARQTPPGRGAARAPRRGGDAVTFGTTERASTCRHPTLRRGRPHRPRLDTRAGGGGGRALRPHEQRRRRHDRGLLDAGAERQGRTKETRYSRMPRRIASATAAARSETPSFS